MKLKVAIFDFDGTIYKKETFSLLMSHLKEHSMYGNRYKRFYRSILLPYISYKLKLYPEEKMKASMMQRYLKTFTGLTQEELDTYFAEVAYEMKSDLNLDVIARMKQHAADGYYILIVSGAFVPLLQVISADMPVDHIIATEVPYRNGLFDEKAEMVHVHSTRKTELILSFLADKKIDWENSVAYGDSISDVSVLQMVGNPVAVFPDDKLLEVANKNKWEILNERVN